MLYSEKLRPFAAAHPCRTIDVDGAQFRYILTGKPEGRTLVFLNGGMNTLEMWTRWRTPGACCCSTIRSSCAPTRRP